MHRVNGWTLAMLACLAGCGDEPTGDLFSVDGIVQGRVTAGGPVADAWVAVEGTYPLGNGNHVSVYDSVRTDGGWRYLGRVGVMNLPDTVVSIIVRVWPPPATSLAPASRGDLSVRVMAALPPADTLVVDFELTPN
jgi:hypothetical protein